MTVAVLGAGGTMGGAMAVNIARAGMRVRGWNRTAGRTQALADAGGELLASPAEAAQGAEVIVSMLSDSDAVLDSMNGGSGALEGARADAIWAQMGTIGEAGAARCAELAGEHGITFVDAPVLGTREPAQDGELVVLGSGPDREEVRERLRPIFQAVAARTMWVGPAGAGTRLKLVANSWVLTVAEGAAEAAALAEGLGLDPRLLLEAVEGGPLDLPYLRSKSEAILARDFEPSFRLALAAKDAGLVQQAAELHGLDLPLFDAIAARMREGAHEHGGEDLIATYWKSAPR